VDPTHRLGGGGVWPEAEKKIVTLSKLAENWVAEYLLVQNVLQFLYLPEDMT
jgi:hypothetical protein